MTDLEITQVSPDRYSLAGELDMASAKTLQEALEPVVAANSSLVLEMADLSFIDSTGLRALLTLSGQMNGSAPLVLANVSSSVRRVLDIVGLDALPGIKVETDG